ncbi:helix-turn-helix domain-containing protein [Nonomuraea sp. B12E4]|uniref:helix-turn-helix domain-containing protein n=1 Tax=Nonomuraea sp. B12E4 TaxID=3153564 RepID=UPI00325FD562
MSADPPRRKRLMRTREVADLFDVQPDTVIGWAQTGKLRSLRTPGGHEYRFRVSDVEAFVKEDAIAAEVATQ